MLLCQISDPHVTAPGRLAYGHVDTAPMLARCVAHVLQLPQRPDVVVLTGDLVDLGRAEEYQRLREIIAALPMPVYVLPGNHDDRVAMRSAFSDHAYLPAESTFLNYAVDLGPIRLVALDSLIAGQGGGELCDARLDWLDRTLDEAPGTPTVVALHHPPFDTGIAYMDRIGLRGAQAFERVIARHRQVQRVLAGHLHRAITAAFGGTVASTCPSPAHQVALDFAPGTPGQFSFEPPGYQLHWWNGRQLVSHTLCVGEFAGPYPFRRA